MFKFIRTLPYHIKTAIVSIFRHFAMSVSAINAVSFTLILLGALLVLAGNVQTFTQNIESDVRIHVVLHESVVSQNTIEEIKSEIAKIERVSEVEFSNKDEELELMILERGEELAMYRGEQNPLSHAFFVNVENAHYLKEVSDLISEISGVYAVHYGGDSIARMVDLLEGVRIGGYVFVTLLALFALFLIASAIRLTIFARRDEIAIMRHVGAENWFIKTPFMLEGVLIGLLGSVVPSLVIWYGYHLGYQACNGRFIASLFTLVAPDPFIKQVVITMVLFGVVVGLIGSFFTTGKYLKWKR